MSERETTSWAMLNAYVDGELTPDAAAEVAARLAVDREAAAQVATLTRLRAAVRTVEAGEPAPPFVLPQTLPRAWPRARPRRPSRAALVAAALLVISAGLAALGLTLLPASPAPLSNAIAAHRLWLSQPSQARMPAAEVALAGADLGKLPDLSLASLSLAHLALDLAGPGGGGMLAGYVGPNGCRVGLWIAPVDQALPTRPALRDRDGLAIRAWRGPHASYALLGQGIDTARLDGIAALVARLTGGERALPDDQVAALAEARGKRPACLG
ncbi:hypothetical protein [Bosea sp. BK604]|uniref:hypothetical protein n=1 Tax=Bosea sp. BK604 TaxID=2512180 RepID=UPI0010466EDF|nr:hypothetical protein [Bosea sp. BK604]TCR65742.1 hypothetical protein EV560_105505 [Bosea sp. BK604]